MPHTDKISNRTLNFLIKFTLFSEWLNKKMSLWTKCNFSTTDSFFLPKFQDLQWKDFSRVFENFTEIFSLLQQLQLFHNFLFLISKLRRNGQSHVMFNVQRRQTTYLKARSKCTTQVSQKLEVFLWSLIWPCWLSPAAAGPILTARLSSVHRYLWLGMKCLVVFKHNSPDVIMRRVNVWRLWWPFTLANKFTYTYSWWLCCGLFSQLRRVSRRIVLLKNETRRYKKHVFFN